MKDSVSFKKGDKVKVSAYVTGFGIAPIGIVTDVETFMGQTLVSVDYIEPSEIDGRKGCTVSNLGMLELI